MVGPNLLNNLVSTITRFRLGKYAVSGDIEQKFHQISVSPKERDALRFLWRENSNKVVSDYKMNVHLFGKNDSPCVANFALKKVGADKKDIIHPSLVTSIDQDFYMGDFLRSDNSEEHLTRITKTVISVLKESGFRLTKFVPNNQNILNQLLETEILNEKAIAEQSDQESTHKALGILWNVKTGELRIKFLDKTFLNTKRGLLSLFCSIFNPFGIVSPCLIEPKLVIQELWKRKVDWDEDLPSDLKYQFQEWRSQLRYIPRIFVSRYYGIETDTETTEFHFFADSSNQAYGVVVYLRSKLNSDVKVSFVLGKSRLAPIKEKSLTIPKLELQAALIAVRIKEKLVKEANVQVSKLYFWSNSKTVLKFIRNENTRFPTYVMHRINEIRPSSDILIGILYQKNLIFLIIARVQQHSRTSLRTTDI